MSKSLTEDLILQRTKAGSLENVKNLNLWGNDIEDVRILKEMPNIEVLSLSVNKISSLKSFQYCKKLTELYLRKNLISDISEIRYIQGLPSLKVLWLWDNPCAQIPNYRETILSALPNLIKLDNQAVTNEERAQIPNKDHRNRKDERKDPEFVRDENFRRDASPALKEIQRNRPRKDEARTDNLLCAVLALVKELDDNCLEVVKREIDRRLVDLGNR